MFRQDNVRRHAEELPADAITVLGSGSIVQQLANLGLIDEYQLVVVPLVLGSGKRLFEDVKLDLHLEDSPAFANGVVVVTYTSAGG